MTDKPLPTEKILSFLAETPIRITEMTAELGPKQLRAAPEPDGWSLNDVLAHLRCCADLWGDYIARILAEERPAIRAISPRRWIEQTDYPELEFQLSFDAFVAQREDLMATLNALTADEWSRAAVVTSVGRTIDRTVLNFAERLARHERSHYRQIANTAAAVRDM